MTEPNPVKAGAPVRAVRTWLDRHAHRDSRTRVYLEFVQALASVLAVGGLVGLIWQINEANQTARRATYNETIDAIAELTKVDLEHPGLTCALYPGVDSDYARLSQLSQVAVQYLILGTNIHERSWREYRAGLLEEEDWLAQDLWFREWIVRAGMFPAIWEMDRVYHPADFMR